MSYVLSLIAARKLPPLTEADAERGRQILEAAGGNPGRVAWLSPGEACDIPFETIPGGGMAALRAAFADRPLDVNVVPAALRRKRLLVADMDSTLIEQECIDELAAEIGRRDEVAAITERTMRGEVAFEPALRERVRLLGGMPVAVAARLLEERITFMPGARTLVATMRASGAHTTLVSGGFTVFAEPVAQRLGFDAHRANRLVVEAETFTGIVAEPILGREAKEATLAELTGRLGLSRDETLAVGDGANDLGMIRRAGLGVAYHAKPAVRAEAGAAIDHGDLTALLFLQGYRREEFVDATPA